MKSISSGSALVVAALLLSFLLFSARPSVAETLLSQLQQQKQVSPQVNKPELPIAASLDESVNSSSRGTLKSEVIEAREVVKSPVSPAGHYIATAYSLRGRTASGRMVSHGIIAADPRVLPLGSRVRLEAGSWSGEYLVADTGGSIRGRKIDIWTPSTREAMRFGRRTVKLTVLSYGAKRSTAKKRRIQI